MIVEGIIIGRADGDESDYPTNSYRVEITSIGKEIIASTISPMGGNAKNIGLIATFDNDEIVLIYLDTNNTGYILGSIGTNISGALAGETILSEQGGAKIHLGDGEGFNSAASGAGSLTLVAQRMAMAVGDVEEYSKHVNEEFFDSDYQDNPTIPYTPDFPEEGYYIETDQGDSFHMASGSIHIKSAEANGTEIEINADGTIDINSNGNVSFQGGQKVVLADGDSITIDGGGTLSVNGGSFVFTGVSGGPIVPTGPPMGPTGVAGILLTGTITSISGGTITITNGKINNLTVRKERVE